MCSLRARDYNLIRSWLYSSTYWLLIFFGTVQRLLLIFLNSKSSRSEEHTSELQSRGHLVCRLLLEKKNHHTIEFLLVSVLLIMSLHSPRSTLFPYTTLFRSYLALA